MSDPDYLSPFTGARKRRVWPDAVALGALAVTLTAAAAGWYWLLLSVLTPGAAR